MAHSSPKPKPGGDAIPTHANVVRPWPDWLNRDWFAALILILTVLLAYLPVAWAGYVWDDQLMLAANPCIVGPLGLKEIWTTSAADICPLTLTTFWVEHALWGLNPLPYHLVNVLLHAACAVLLWQVLRSLRVPGAWLGAALWALHPVEVQSVAWIAEMKNTQSGLFFLLSLLFFVQWLEKHPLTAPNGKKWKYALALVFAAMAMASKSSTVILPAVLCLCAWWMEGQWHWRNLARAGPFFLMSLVATALSLWTQKLQLNSATDIWARTWPERLAASGDAVWFYLSKLIWPYPLVAVYPRWQIDATRLVSYLPLAAVFLALFILWRNRAAWARPWFFIFAYFLTALLPVLGLVDNFIFRYSLVFDHFQYLASMGPLALVGAGLSRFATLSLPKKTWQPTIFCAVPLLLLGGLSWQKTWVYQNEGTLWADTLAHNPTCWIGLNNVGTALLQKGQVDQAITQFEKALAIYPSYVDAGVNLGTALLQKGQTDQAISLFQQALQINPNSDEAHSGLGAALLQKGQIDEAFAEFQAALQINPNLANAHYNLGNILFKKGQIDEAIVEYQKSLVTGPGLALAHYNLGAAFLKQGQVDLALNQFQEALALNPNDAAACNSLGDALRQLGRLDEAIPQFQKAVEIDPTNADAHNNLGNSFLQKGLIDAAIPEYQRSLALDPNNTEAHYNLGVALFKQGQVAEATVQFQKLVEMDPGNVQAHNSLGIALGQAGKIPDAIAQFEAALRINPHDTAAQNNLARAQGLLKTAPPKK